MSVTYDYGPTVLAILAILLPLLFWIQKRHPSPPVHSEKKLNNPELQEESIDDDSNWNDHLTPSLEEKQHVPFAGIKVTLPGGAQSFYNIVNDRRSIRKFDPNKLVDIKILRDCIKAAGTAPSGAHTEPWIFCVVGDAELKDQIRTVIEAEEQQNYASRMSRQWTVDLQPLKTNFIKEYLTDAPYLVLIFKQIYSMRDDGKKKQHYYNEISVAIATGILLCALQSAGLNSLVTTPLNCGPSLKTILDRPVNEKLLVLIPVGYASSDCMVPDLHRKPVQEILVEY